ncbi:MAG TPA: BTAD domain-containing putative transcriptional regulator [Streptosporangiaceae bacterium]
MKSLAVRVLGDFAVDGVPPHTLGSRKARLALHLLALGGGQAVSSGVLIDAIWAAARPGRPEDQLAVLVSRLRSVVGRDRIGHHDGGYQLRCDWLDAAELAGLTDEVDRRQAAGNVLGAAAAARVALSLVRGDGPRPLPGEWALLRQAELDRLISRSRQVAAGALLAAGDWMAAADGAAAALEREPYDEAALRVLLRAYTLGGRVAAALAAYASTRERLADELGTDPSPQTQAVYTAILRGELVPPGPLAAGQSATAGLVGRDGELAYLDAAALRSRGGSAEVIIVDGEAGIGKTTLLRAWAARRTAAGDTVLMAPCGPLDRAMPLDALLTALAALLRRLGSEVTTDALGSDAAVLGPVLGPVPGAAPGPRPLPALSDSMLGPAVLYAALVRVLGRLAERAPLVTVVDDAHLAGPALADWLRFARRAGLPAVLVAAIRPGEGEPLPGTGLLHLDVLGRDAAAELVGPARVDELYRRSRGHPLFLTELAQQAAGTEPPVSLVESVSARCDELGEAGAMLRAAAVIGQDLDVDLLAAVLGRPLVAVLDDAERAAAGQLLVEQDGTFRFRHELVREALAASATPGRQALLHRQAGRVLAQRPDADPATVAYHARMGGDLELAAQALRDAAARATERFDHAAAEALLDDALLLHAEPDGWLARARVRTRRGRYPAALEDVERAAAAGPAALEVGAWAAYFGRRFGQAAQFAEDGALAAGDRADRSRCLAAGGRIHHAAGHLDQAELLLGEAVSLAQGADRVTAAAWLGVLRAHQSRAEEALTLLRPAARGQIGAEHTSATLHALLFTGHAHALAGRPALALAAFGRYTAEVERRQVPRFAGRAVNFAGWVLRNLGAWPEALDRHQQALEVARRDGTAEVGIAALEDLAEQCLAAGDPDGARSRLAEAGALLDGDLVFGWRLALKHQLLSGRLALLCGDPAGALAAASALGTRAAALGVPRYTSAARLVVHRARNALRMPVDLASVRADLDALDRAVSIEAWWWTGELAADFGQQAWLDLAAERAARLAGVAGDYADGLRAAAGQRLDGWQAAIRLPSARRDQGHRHGQRLGGGACLLDGSLDGALRRAPGRGPGRRVQRAQERGELGQAQPPGGQLGRSDQPGRHGDRAHPHLAEAGRGHLLGEPLRERVDARVPGRLAVAERAERRVHRVLGRMSPARRERAGRQRGTDPAHLGQPGRRGRQVVQAERGDHQIEAARAERQRHRVGRDRVQRRARGPQHANGQVGRHHLAGPGGQRGPARRPGARAQVEHPAAGQRHRRGRDQHLGQPGVHPPRPGGPVTRRRLVAGPQARTQLSRGAALTALSSHHASSSS